MISDTSGTLRRFLLDALTGNSMSLLDIGCGGGTIARYLSSHLNRVVGIDPDFPKGFFNAPGAKHPANLSFVAGRGESLCFSSSSFDSLLFCQSLHHIPIDSQSAAIEEANRVLATGGRFVIIEPVYGKGALGAIVALAKGEKRAKAHALRLAEGMDGWGYEPVLRSQFQIDCICGGYEEIERLYFDGDPLQVIVRRMENRIKNILAGCRRSTTGELILEYAVDGFVYRKVAVEATRRWISPP